MSHFWMVVACLVWVGLLPACGDESGSGEPLPGAGGNYGGRTDMAPDRLGSDMAVPNIGQSTDSGAVSIDGGSADDAGIAECSPGQVRCTEQRADFEQFCRGDSRWAIRPCDAGSVCLGGSCIADPVGCVPGESICLPDGSPGVCVDDAWQPDTPCAGGQTCNDGECVSDACAFAARSASYLGCDYLIVDLPNTAYETRDTDGDGSPNGTTQDAPLGLVVANSSPTDPVRATVLAPNGQPAQLVASQRIDIPPNILPPNVMYPVQTVSSEIQDAQGNIVQQGLMSAVDVEIPPGGFGTFLIPPRMVPLETSSLRNDAFRLKTDAPVVAYQFGPYCCNYSFTNDASLLLPTPALGTRYKYLGVPTHVYKDIFGNVVEQTPAVIAVVSPTDGNDVTVRIPGGIGIARDPNGQVVQQGDTIRVLMNAQDVLLVTPADGRTGAGDLTGSEIRSSSPVASFSTHTCTFYPEDQPACDHLQEQLFPVSTWGTSFQLVPPAERNVNFFSEVIYWKFIGSDVATRIQLGVPFRELNAVEPGFDIVPFCQNFLEGGDTIVLQPGQYCEFGTRRAVQATADQPAMILGIIAGQGATGLPSFGSRAGDPSIFLVPPEEQFRQEYTFLTPDSYFSDYVTVVTPSGNELLLDGQPVNIADAVNIAGTPLVFKHLEITDGAHRLQGRAPFGIIVYAYDDFVSYAYTGGLNLTKR